MKRDARPKVLLWCDYGSNGLWVRHRELLAVSPDDYPLSDELREAIKDWALWHDEYLPPDEMPPAVATEFAMEGIRLWRRMVDEMGKDYRVGYWQLGGKKPLWDFDNPKVKEVEERAARL